MVTVSRNHQPGRRGLPGATSGTRLPAGVGFLSVITRQETVEVPIR
jgi:hypothetical protein